MTRTGKEEIVQLDATGLPCKALALRHLSYYHIHSYHTYLAPLWCHTYVMCTLMLKQLYHLQQRQDASVGWLCQ